MTQKEFIISVMENKDGYATLADLYKAYSKSNENWETETPEASIRRTLQTNRDFFKIIPGLWALKKYENKLPNNIKKIIEEEKELDDKDKPNIHQFYQAQIANIGQMLGYKTYIPPQDIGKVKNFAQYLEITEFRQFENFTYGSIGDHIKTIDVIWLQGDNHIFPHTIFEVENTTDFQNSLTKFYELKHYLLNMTIVAPASRKKEFQSRIDQSIYAPIKERIKFLSYDKIGESITEIVSNFKEINRLKEITLKNEY
jgi:hypothetical protein